MTEFQEAVIAIGHSVLTLLTVQAVVVVVTMGVLFVRLLRG